MLQYQYVFGGDLSVVVRQRLITVYSTKFFGCFTNGGFFLSRATFETLFNPFRQISAAPVGGDLSVQLSAFFDKMFSRVIGAVVRSMVIIIGILMILLRFLWMIVGIIMWLALPLMPFIGIILWQLGVSVWK